MRRKSGLCVVLLTGTMVLPLLAWKIVPEDKDKASDIKTILIVDDRLIIVNSKNTLDIRFSDLEKLSKGQSLAPAPAPAAPPPAVVTPVPATPAANPANGDLRVVEDGKSAAVPAPANAPEASLTEEGIRKKIAETGIWYVFTAHPQRFKVFNQKQYVPMKEGMVLKGATINKILYLQNQDQVLFEPTWENSYNFTRYVTEFRKYLDSLRKHLVELDGNIAAAQSAREDALRNIYFLVDQMVKLLKGRDYNRGKIVSADGNVDLTVIKQEDIDPNAMTFYLDLQRKLSKEERNKRDAEKQLKNLSKERSDLITLSQQMEETWRGLAGK